MDLSEDTVEGMVMEDMVAGTVMEDMVEGGMLERTWLPFAWHFALPYPLSASLWRCRLLLLPAVAALYFPCEHLLQLPALRFLILSSMPPGERQPCPPVKFGHST